MRTRGRRISRNSNRSQCSLWDQQLAGGRVGPPRSMVGLVVGLGIAKSVDIGEETGEEIETELGAMSGDCTKIVSGALWGSIIGIALGNRRGGTYIMQYSG